MLRSSAAVAHARGRRTGVRRATRALGIALCTALLLAGAPAHAQEPAPAVESAAPESAPSEGTTPADGEGEAAGASVAPDAPSSLDTTLEGIASKARSRVLEALSELSVRDDASALPVLRALEDRRLSVAPNGRLYAAPPAGGLPESLTRGAGEPAGGTSLASVTAPNVVRRTAGAVIAQLELKDPSPAVRLAAAQALANRAPKEALAPMRRAAERESDAAVLAQLEVVLAQLGLASEDPRVRAEAARTIGASYSAKMQPALRAMLAQTPDGEFAEPDPAVREAAAAAIARIDRARGAAQTGQTVFFGLSLGSVLLLAAMGLAITFGLMGVINMAHGEMLMLGAYATYTVHVVFATYLPPALGDYYLLAALPVAFVTTLGVGMLLERTLIRFLYGRPLDTLLVTWGASLILIQLVRLTFGAQNVAVPNPSWLSGGVEIFPEIVLPFNRMATMGFAVGVVALVWLVLTRTRLGLEVRAVTQNRGMAGSMGVSTARVDMWTFGMGCGIAGLGGVAISQIANVGPELGQGYIIDSFMVVVLGGVGKLAGTLFGAGLLGMVNKLLEPVAGAVLGKIVVLVFVILLIQRRPEGIFALRGRAAEA
jgi:urea transport system permease protein